MITSQLPTIKEIKNLVAFLPKLYAEGFEPIKKWGAGGENDYGFINLPYPEYDPIVTDFVAEASKDYWCDFHYVQNMKNILAIFENTNYAKLFSLFQIKTFLTYCIRRERFCDGHWAAMIERGYIRVILERLSELMTSNN